MLTFKYFVTSMLLVSANAPALAGSSQPADDVSCIYNAMTPEDHENARVMLAEGFEAETAREAQAGGQPAADENSDEAPFMSEHMAEVFEMLQEAHVRCIDLYPWTSGQSEASRFYAFFTIIGDMMTAMLKLTDVDLAVADTYFEENKKKFGKRIKMTSAERASFAAYLDTTTWPKDDIELRNTASDYLETKLMKEQLRRAFSTGDFSGLE